MDRVRRIRAHDADDNTLVRCHPDSVPPRRGVVVELNSVLLKQQRRHRGVVLADTALCWIAEVRTGVHPLRNVGPTLADVDHGAQPVLAAPLRKRAEPIRVAVSACERRVERRRDAVADPAAGQVSDGVERCHLDTGLGHTQAPALAYR